MGAKVLIVTIDDTSLEKNIKFSIGHNMYQDKETIVINREFYSDTIDSVQLTIEQFDEIYKRLHP